MEQRVKVTRVFPDGTAQVLHIRQSACSGDCHKCQGCGAAEEKLLLSARNPIGAEPGDTVEIESETGPVLRGAMILYMLPLLQFFLGYGLGAAVGLSAAAFGCCGFLLAIGIVILFDRRVAGKKPSVYTIKKINERGGRPLD